MKILLYGYYNQNNFGDDLFKFIFKKYFEEKNINLVIYNPNQLDNYQHKNNKLFKTGSFSLDKDEKLLKHLVLDQNNNDLVDVIFLGGGQIINEYFMIPLFNYIKINNLNTIPIYGASIGYNNDQSLNYIKFIDKCIFRNQLNIIDNKNYFFDNDIVFGIDRFISYDKYDIKILPNTIGYYLIDEITDTNYDILKNFTNKIKLMYKIRFIIFHKNKDIVIINKLIADCNLTSYEIISKDCIDTILEILSTEYHLCLRFHSHIICYKYKCKFISFPLTDKTLEFNKLYNIKYSFDVDEMVNLLTNHSIIFQDITFNFNTLDSFFINISKIDNNYTLLSIWNVYNEIYNNFINIIKNKDLLNQDDINNYINYIADQIELNIVTYINSSYRYGIKDQLKTLFNKYNNKNTFLQNEFFKLMHNISQNYPSQ